MNTLLEPSADASGICSNEVLPHLVDAGQKTSKDLGTANFSGKTSAVQKRGGGQQHAPSASLVSRPESDLTRKRPVHQRREMKPFRGQQRPSQNAPTKKYTKRSRDR
nr:unnamed protein product [Callosobruchus chinensis]